MIHTWIQDVKSAEIADIFLRHFFGYSTMFYLTTNLSHKSRRKIISCGSSQIYGKKSNTPFNTNIEDMFGPETVLSHRGGRHNGGGLAEGVTPGTFLKHETL